MEDVFFVVLFINAVDGNFEKSFLSVEFVFSIVFRESDGYIYAVARVMADELFFKVIDVSVGADHKISAVSFCVSTFKFHAVNGADIVDIDGITVLNGEGRQKPKWRLMRRMRPMRLWRYPPRHF